MNRHQHPVTEAECIEPPMAFTLHQKQLLQSTVDIYETREASLETHFLVTWELSRAPVKLANGKAAINLE